MALAGVHITFGISSPGTFNTPPTVILLGQAVASQTMVNGGTSTIRAPGSPGAQPCISISASAPIFYALGANPDPTGVNGPRRYMDPAFGREDIFCNAGDLFAWQLA